MKCAPGTALRLLSIIVILAGIVYDTGILIAESRSKLVLVHAFQDNGPS